MSHIYNQCKFIKANGCRCKKTSMLSGYCDVHLKYIEDHPIFEMFEEEFQENYNGCEDE